MFPNDVILNGHNQLKGIYFLGLRSFVRRRDRNKKCNNRVTSMDLFKVKRYYRNECRKRWFFSNTWMLHNILFYRIFVIW